MFKNILLPVDLSDRHEPALGVAADLARAGHGRVVLLHVIETIPGLGIADEPELYARLEAQAQAHLGQLDRRLAEANVEHATMVLYGARPYEVIVTYAAEAGIDLIVLSSHRVAADRPAAGWGTVSYKVGILSRCPVLLVK